MLSNVWLGTLKCGATGDLLNLRVFRFDLCKLMRLFNKHIVFFFADIKRHEIHCICYFAVMGTLDGRNGA